MIIAEMFLLLIFLNECGKLKVAHYFSISMFAFTKEIFFFPLSYGCACGLECFKEACVHINEHMLRVLVK